MRSRRPAAAVRYLAHALAAVLVLAATLAAGGDPAAAAARPLSECTATTGVIVAVDLSHWGGPVLRSCGTTPTTGYALLNQGGWHTAGTEHDGPGFICRIGYSGYRHGAQYPAPSQQACVQTPPAGAYWASWEAGPGQTTWTYSRYGALSYRPQPGTVSLWEFGGTNLSGTAGSALPAISPGRLRAQQAAGAAPAGSPAIVNAGPVASSASVSRASASRGSAVPTILAGAIALFLAVAGIAVVRRRRRRERS